MRYPWFLTKAVVARVVPLSVMRGVGAVGVPVRDGDARLAFSTSSSLIADWILVADIFHAGTLVMSVPL